MLSLTLEELQHEVESQWVRGTDPVKNVRQQQTLSGTKWVSGAWPYLKSFSSPQGYVTFPAGVRDYSKNNLTKITELAPDVITQIQAIASGVSFLLARGDLNPPPSAYADYGIGYGLNKILIGEYTRECVALLVEAAKIISLRTEPSFRAFLTEADSYYYHFDVWVMGECARLFAYGAAKSVGQKIFSSDMVANDLDWFIEEQDKVTKGLGLPPAIAMMSYVAPALLEPERAQALGY